jgi:thioredoxin 1
MAKPILMDFYADWCGPCRMQGPILDEIKAAFEGKAEIKKINVDKENDLASKYGVFVVPTLILEKDGKELNKDGRNIERRAYGSAGRRPEVRCN